MDCPICGRQTQDGAATCDACGGDTKYTIQAPDGTQYGPYTLTEARQFAQQGRVAPTAVLVSSNGQAHSLADLNVVVILPTVVPQPRPAASGSGGSTCLIVGVVIGAFVLVFGGIITAIMFPVFGRAREKARQTSCLSNEKQISLGILMYAQDYDEYLPAAATYEMQIDPYTKNQMLFIRPSTQIQPGSYEYNSHLDGMYVRDLSRPAQTPILWDRDVAIGSGPHNGGGNVGFTDGHCKWHTDSGFAGLSRDPGVAPR